MSHAKYQSSRPCGFGEEEFSKFSLYAYKKNQLPPNWWPIFVSFNFAEITLAAFVNLFT